MMEKNQHLLNQRGFTLLETLIAGTLLTLTALALLQTLLAAAASSTAASSYRLSSLLARTIDEIQQARRYARYDQTDPANPPFQIQPDPNYPWKLIPVPNQDGYFYIDPTACFTACRIAWALNNNDILLRPWNAPQPTPNSTPVLIIAWVSKPVYDQDNIWRGRISTTIAAFKTPPGFNPTQSNQPVRCSPPIATRSFHSVVLR